MRRPKLFQSLFKSPNTTTACFNVEGMTCSGCVARVEKVIRALPGIHSVVIDLPTGRASIDYDVAKTASDQIGTAITAAGFKVES
jgi:copper chaperone CopZ